MLSLFRRTLYSDLILIGGDIQGRLPFGILSDFPTTSAFGGEVDEQYAASIALTHFIAFMSVYKQTMTVFCTSRQKMNK